QDKETNRSAVNFARTGGFDPKAVRTRQMNDRSVARGAKFGNEDAPTHSLYSGETSNQWSISARVRRTARHSREKNEWKARIRADLGGDLSTAEKTLLERASWQLLLINIIDADRGTER